jgi:uncharacterized membrane protein
VATEDGLMLVPGWHPFVVQFPVALSMVATVLLSLARFAREPLVTRLAVVGTWNLVIAAFMMLVALATGLGAVLDLSVSDAAHQAISLHLKAAMFTSLALILVAVWRGAGNAAESRPSTLFICVLIATMLALGYTAYRGVLNVFVFGVGISQG